MIGDATYSELKLGARGKQMAMCLSAANLATRPYILCMRALHNLINNSNNDDRQEEKSITTDEKKYYLCSVKNQNGESGLPSTRECWEFNN